MLKIIYFICCILSICVTVYMCWEWWTQLRFHWQTWHNIAWLLGTIGWIIITFKIVTRQYRWAAYLCK